MILVETVGQCSVHRLHSEESTPLWKGPCSQVLRAMTPLSGPQLMTWGQPLTQAGPIRISRNLEPGPQGSQVTGPERARGRVRYQRSERRAAWPCRQRGLVVILPLDSLTVG